MPKTPPHTDTPISPGTTVKPVANAFEILRHLNRTQKPERAADIARQLGLNPSTCFNILRTLVDQRILSFNNKGKTYAVGLGLLKLVKSTVTDKQRMLDVRHIMIELAAEHRVTITVWKKVANRLVLLGAESSPSGISISMFEGQRVPKLMGASGRVLAGFDNTDDAQLRAEFNNIRWAKPLDFESYMRDVSQAKTDGWAVDRGYFSSGITTLAVPIMNDGDANFALSAVSIGDNLTDAKLKTLREALTQASGVISDILF